MREPTIGSVIDGYTLEKKLGAGAFGIVYRAVDGGGDAVAIKVLKLEQIENSEIVFRFFHEVDAVHGIGHPGTVGILRHGRVEDTQQPYYVMELLAGETLQELLLREGRLSPLRAVELLEQIAATLEAVHRAGVVHRDLKPENIFLLPAAETDAPPRTKILDFGMAKLSEAQFGSLAQQIKTQAGSVRGTPCYMAPEQIEDVSRVDGQADVYSCGCIAYECLTGYPPFTGPPIKVLVDHQIHAPRPVTELAPSTPPPIAELVHQLLAKAPRDRPTVDQLVARLTAQRRQLTPAVAQQRTVVDTVDVIGRRLGPYRVITEIGRGGMSRVYLAQDDVISAKVAIKLLTAELAADATIVGRLFAEARAVNELNDPALVKVIAKGETPAGTPYLVMEHVAGETLDRALRRRRSFGLEALPIVLAIARVMARVHRRGVVHRDLKPSNVMMAPAPDGELGAEAIGPSVRLLDFGVAKVQRSSPDGTAIPGPTAQGPLPPLLGSVDYMAPEQGRDPSQVTDRADVYSLGVVLFELVTGERPLSGATVYQTITRHQLDEPPRLEARLPGLPTALGDLVASMLAKDPTLRPSMTEVVRRIEPLVHDPHRTVATVDSRERSTLVIPQPGSRTRPLAVAAAGAGLLLLGGWLWYSLAGRPNPRVDLEGIAPDLGDDAPAYVVPLLDEPDLAAPRRYEVPVLEEEPEPKRPAGRRPAR